MQRPVTFTDRLRYRFEDTLSAGPIAIIGWLAILSLIIVLVAGGVIALGGITAGVDEKGDPDQWSFTEAAWNSLMRTFDAGNMADDKGWPLRAVTLLVTIGGIFIVSTLIGTITSGMENRIEEMRKGRSRVIETNHTLILGWSPKVYSILGELVIANENQSKPRVVILADRDKVEMEDEIRSKLPNTRNTRVICRSGSPLDLDDLDVVNPHEAKSIIILSPESDNPDTYVVKSILALTNNPHRRKDDYHIVAEIREAKNLEAARLVGKHEAELILSGDVIARVTAQTCRQSGLSVVYQELLDFDGAEIYFREEPKLVGKTYRQALSCFETSTVIGLMTSHDKVLVNPAMDRVIAQGDQVIAIAEDDDTIVFSDSPGGVDRDAVRTDRSPPPGAERTLLIGWNEKGESVVRELDGYVAEGSQVTILSNNPRASEGAKHLDADLKCQRVTFIHGDTTDRATLEAVEPAAFQHIIVLCDHEIDVQQADARTLITLLHLRNLAETAGRDFSIVSEMLDIRNRALAEVARADDFIVSDKLISLLLTQVSENRHLSKVFEDLFDPDGSEIYLKPIGDYVVPGRPVDFYTLVDSAAARGETAIGYRIHANHSNPNAAYGVVINPKKTEKVTFAADDRIIVLAED
ncbi:MAG: NAD-binding protein [Planctomycetaceae bacterium]|nr:NAD-binding protein [Planctomycetaceae bacterium]